MGNTVINTVILHCSDSDFGDVDEIDKWHRARGWSGIGYHFVITNGRLKTGQSYSAFNDGLIQAGRDINKIGAHCKGHNTGSVGVCLIGRHNFTARQLYSSLPELLGKLMFEHDISVDRVFGHCEFSRAKTCPNITREIIRKIAEYSV